MAKILTDDKLAFDTHLLDVYLTGLQAEIEAKLRRVTRFRAQMRKIDRAGDATDRRARIRAARALVAQVEAMLETNLLVKDSLEDLLKTARHVLEDVNAAE